MLWGALSFIDRGTLPMSCLVTLKSRNVMSLMCCTHQSHLPMYGSTIPSSCDKVESIQEYQRKGCGAFTVLREGGGWCTIFSFIQIFNLQLQIALLPVSNESTALNLVVLVLTYIIFFIFQIIPK